MIDVVPIPNGIALVTNSFWQRARLSKSLKVSFDGGINSDISSETLEKQYHAALDGNGWKTLKTEGDSLRAEERNGKFAAVYSQEYESQCLAHSTMEPMNCTAHVTADSWAVWGPVAGTETREQRICHSRANLNAC